MIDVKKIITFIALFALTSAAMAADVQGQINSATAKGVVVVRAIAAGIGVLAVVVEGLRLVVWKKPVLRELGYILAGLILIIGAAEVVNYFYSSGSSTGF
jgi:peptidoglycan/LPS O-acetylase OafA/YrhL